MAEVVEQLRAALKEHYALGRELGHGGMATVYLAQDLKHGRQVAIKVLRANLVESLGPGRFLREIRIACRLTHPNILPVHDSGRDGSVLFYVMPYVDGESLRDRIRREGRLSLDDAVRITREVAEGLAYAHREGIVHRDIKPGNVLLEAGHAVIADFGLARAIHAASEDFSSARLVLGTPTYMSPEQSVGENQVDERSDIYSLGCVLHEMLAGQPPFTGPSPQVLLVQHLQNAPPRLSNVRQDVPDSIQAAVDRSLAKNPADRFQSATEFADALARSRPPYLTGGAPRLQRTLRWGSLLLGGAAALTWLLVGRGLHTGKVESSVSRWEDLGGTTRDPTHLAVLYFDHESRDSTLKSLASGLTEDLIDQLGQIQALSVISANGVRPYRDKSVPLDSIATSLSVGTVVAGTVTGSLDRPRVTVRLIDPITGRQLDSKVIEAAAGDVMALHASLAQEVTRFLRERLGREVKFRELRSGTRVARAWLLVRRVEDLRNDARALFNSGDGPAAHRALDAADSLLSLAEHLDPHWIDAIVLRGWLSADQIEVSEGNATAIVAQWAPVGLAHAEHALAERSDYPPALELRGQLRFMQWNYSDRIQPDLVEAAERDLRAAAVPDNPTQARAWAMLSYLLLSRGALVQANLAARKAYEADAFLENTSAVLFRLYLTSLMSRKWPEAESWCAEGHRRFPADWLFTFCRLTLLYEPSTRSPDVEEAWRLNGELARLVAPSDRAQLAPRWLMIVAGVVARAGQRDSAEKVIRAARRAGAGDEELDYYEAGARTWLNEREAALTLLDRNLKASPGGKAFIRADPMFQPLRNEPRFKALVSEKE